MDTCILAFDLGTGGNKASIYDAAGNCLGSHFEGYDTFFPQAGWHEQRPDDWWNAVVKSTKVLLEKTKIDGSRILCLAISGHSMCVVPVDKSGRVLRKTVPIWSDTRAKKQADAFFERVDYEKWYAATGNGFSKECYAI